MSYLVIPNDNNDYTVEKPYHTFPYKLDKFQEQSIYAIDNGANVLVTAHTSAGKSTVAEYAIGKAFKTNQKVIYTSPIKTLSNQKYYDFKQKYDPNNIGIMTGDIKINPEAHCSVMTTEILRNMLFKGSKFMDDLGFVIFDEVHYINDKERGHVWEECLIMLPPSICIIMLSATIDKAEEFATWIGNIKKKPIYLVSTLYRPVPLNHNIFIDGEKLEIMNSNKKFNYSNYDYMLSYFKKTRNKYFNEKATFNPFVEYLKENNNLPCIFFIFSRKKCKQYAKYITINLINHEERAEIEKIFNYNIRKLTNEPDRMSQIYETKELLMKGIGIHHSGLIPLLKEIIEIIFSKGLIKLLFATETFAVGVNMPTKTVVFTELSKRDDNGYREVYTNEYMQMSGRAGRRGLDTIGTVIYFPIKNMLEKHEITSVMLGKTCFIESKFMLDCKFVLKVIQCKTQDIIKMLSNSLLQQENDTEIMYSKKLINELENSKNKEDIIDDKFIEFYELSEKLKNTISNKDKKKIRKTLKELENNLPYCKNLEDILDKIHNRKNKEKEICDTKYYYENLPFVFDEDIKNVIEYLKDNSYINLGNKIERDSFDIDNNLLTIKGIIASEINECNEIIIAEIIDNNILDDLSPIEIISVLSIFASDSGNTEDAILLSDLKISQVIIDAIAKIIEIDQNLSQSTFKYKIKYDTKLSLDMVLLANEWSTNGKMENIYLLTDMFEGNFIKNMQKITNIVQELISVYEIIQKPEMIPKLQEISPLILRDVVSFTSLYTS